jgi:hypothetical protein
VFGCARRRSLFPRARLKTAVISGFFANFRKSANEPNFQSPKQLLPFQPRSKATRHRNKTPCWHAAERCEFAPSASVKLESAVSKMKPAGQIASPIFSGLLPGGSAVEKFLSR